MNRLNFDSLSNFKAPDEWIRKAADIPEVGVKRRGAFSVYRLAAAASVVLVSAAGILMYMFFGNNSAPVIPRGGMDVSDYPPSAAVDETTPAAVPAETIAVLSTDAGGNTVISYAAVTEPGNTGAQPTQAQRAPAAPATARNGTERTSSTVPASEWATEAIEAPVQTEAQRSTLPLPTEQPKPTAPPATQKPTGSVTDTPLEAEETDTLEFIKAIDPPSADIAQPIRLRALRRGSIEPCDQIDGKKARILSLRDGTFMAYCDSGIPLSSIPEGTIYDYVFYDSKGVVIAQGTITI